MHVGKLRLGLLVGHLLVQREVLRVSVIPPLLPVSGAGVGGGI